MPKSFGLICLILSTFFSISAYAQEARYLLGGKPAGSNQSPSSIGSYARGCLAGGEELAINGKTWQAMRLSRNRNWGHPDMIAYLKRTSAKVAKETRWKGLYIGDISQPRGGPMISGHASHQLGLDADIWMLPAKNLKLSRTDRENLSSISIRSKDQRKLNKNWTKDHMEVMRIAASDPKVARIFVTAPAKIYMCKHAKGDRKWLRKIRPWWGHHYHFHVRLKCPKGNSNCKNQDAIPSGTGCNKDLKWWVTDALKPAKPVKKDPNAPKKPKKKHPRQFTMADLPNQCSSVLKSR